MRVLATWATSWPKSNVMSTPALGFAKQLLVQVHDQGGRCTLAFLPASPSSSGDGHGLKALAVLLWKKPEALGQLRLGSGCAATMSLTSITRRMARAVCLGRGALGNVAGDHRHLGLESMPPGLLGQAPCRAAG